MKRLFFALACFLLLTFVGSTGARMTTIMVGGGVPAAASGNHDCSGDLKFGWSMENVDVTAGSPAGCSDGQATTASVNGTAELSTTQKSDGTYSVHIIDNADYYSFANFDGDEIDYSDGKIIVDVYIDTHAANARLFNFILDSNNGIVITLEGSSSDISMDFVHEHGATVDAVTVDSVNDLTEDEWLRVTMKWKTGVAGVDLYGQICELTPPDTLGDCYETEEDDDLTNWANPADTGNVGNTTANAAAFYIDNLQIYATSGY